MQGLWSLGGGCPGVQPAERPAADRTLPCGPGLTRVLTHPHMHPCTHVFTTQNSGQISPLRTDTISRSPVTSLHTCTAEIKAREPEAAGSRAEPRCTTLQASRWLSDRLVVAPASQFWAIPVQQHWQPQQE